MVRSNALSIIPKTEETFIQGRVLVVGGGRSYYRPFAKFGEYDDNLSSLSGPPERVRKNVSLVMFTGGEDVSPALYGEATNPRTHYNWNRDKDEVFAFHLALAYGLPMVGVCRGAQFLCVMAGGRLIQHMEHYGQHPVQLWDGRSVIMNSLHHQMQVPPKSAKILGWMNPISPVHLDGNGNEIESEIEVEVAYYPNIRAVGMQYHPEMMASDSEGHRIAPEFVEKFIMGEEMEHAA